MPAIKNAMRDTLRTHLPPQMYAAMRWRWWYMTFYLPWLIRALVVTKHPVSEGVGALVADLQLVNVARPTAFCRIMSRHGSDKGAGWHRYTTIYARLLGDRIVEPLRIFELGIGTNTPGLASSMGVYGRPGASLRAWRDLFPHAEIYGADIDRAILFTENRIQTFYCDQRDAETIRGLWVQPALRMPVDVIIDDGLHTIEGNVSFLTGSLEHVRPGGLYVIEDIRVAALDHWRVFMRDLQRQYPRHEIALVQLPSPTNQFDNNLLIIRPH
jgi:hypothetical protein